MDPLSVTAGIIALFQAGGKVTTGLKKIANLRNAPDILLALNNEVADLHCLVENVDDVLRQHREGKTHLVEARERAGLPAYVNRVQRWTIISGFRSILMASFGKHCAKAQERDPRGQGIIIVSLVATLLVSRLFTALRNIAQIRDVHILLGIMRLESRNDGTSRIEAAPQPPTEEEDPAEQAVIGSPQPAQVGQGTKLDPDTATGTETHASLQDLVIANSSPAELEQQAYITTFEIARKSCGPRCDCTCHQKVRYRSPGFLDAVFGSLFLGYQASPWFSQGCRNGRCRRSSTRIQYMFPKGFVKRSVALTIACNQYKGPELVLRVLRPRPNDAFIFVCARNGYYHELKRLLENGEASVVDVDEYNRTALNLAVKCGEFTVVELLVQAGSDTFHEDAYGYQPSMSSLARFFARKVRGERNEFEDRTFDLINGHSHIDILDLPELTEAYLRLCPQSFNEVLRSTPRVSIDLTDSLGRTTLHWAPSVGDSEAVEQLIRCGSDPNKTDTLGYTSLHSAIFGNSICLELLLRAKADVKLKNVDGQTVLHDVSAHGWDTTSLDLLLRYGANIEATNHTGRTPLHSAVIEDNYLMVSALLERGANIHAICLDAALYHHSHNSLRTLLDNAAFHYNQNFHNGVTLLHVAAVHADIESLYILMSKPLYKLDTTEEDAHGWTAVQLAQWRALNNEEWSRNLCRPRDNDPMEWYYVFEELLESIMKAQASTAGSIDDEASEESMADSEHSNSQLDETCEDNEDDDESWEDAREDLGGKL